MAPRPGLNVAQVIDAAARLADAKGLHGFALREIAEALGVRTPSLYNHVAGLEVVYRGLTLRALRDLADRIRRGAVGRTGEPALRAMAEAERRYAKDHPGLFAATGRSAENQDEEIRLVAQDLLEIVLRVLSSYGLQGEEALHAARTLRAAITGFVTLEAQGGFGLPADVDRSFEWMVTALDVGLRGSAQRARSERVTSTL